MGATLDCHWVQLLQNFTNIGIEWPKIVNGSKYRFFNEGRDACQGDSGGPLFAKRNNTKTRFGLKQHEIVGITSVGRDCGLNGFPGKS